MTILQLKSPEEIEAMYRANQVVAEALWAMAEAAVPGIATARLDEIGRNILEKHGATSAFLGYLNPSGGVPFPATVCASLNEAVVHGIPSEDVVLKNGDILSLDFGAVLDGWYGDSAITLAIGEIDSKAAGLLETTRRCLFAAIEQTRVGKRIGDLSRAIQNMAEKAGFGVVHEFVGHGIGRKMHEPPPIPNLGRAGAGPRLQVGMVLAIEPMINMGSPDVKVRKDGWTAVTADNKLSAHFEHSVAVTSQGPRILSVRS